MSSFQLTIELSVQLEFANIDNLFSELDRKVFVVHGKSTNSEIV